MNGTGHALQGGQGAVLVGISSCRWEWVEQGAVHSKHCSGSGRDM